MSESLQERFDRARSLGPEERARLLAELDAADPPAAARLRALLAAADAGDSPLDATPWIDDSGDAEEGEEEALPQRIGPYRVLSEVGRGGMGRVYLALQEGEGYSRRLAVKVVAPEGAGADIERRFRDERRILAALEHPGIARFHDAGRDASGRWFLALEYVEGANLIGHARAHGLPLEERLRLFLAVLAAVAHAHARGVVHRDLKPANILVGVDGRPRLLDFGIAKLLDAGAAAPAVQTRTSLRAFTPAYASPEQFRGDAVTPASDVFSLGVVLYELVAGVRPFGGEAGSQAALERQILETDPEPPSTASRRAGAEPGAVAVTPRAHHRLSRDLDAVCLKALRKEPGERYASAAELAADLERLLDGFPVAARGDDRRYRLGRLLSRHRAALAVGAALAVAAVAVGLAIGAARRAADSAPPKEPEPQPFPFGGIGGKDAAELEKEFTARPASVEAGARLVIALEKAGRRDDAALVVARLRQIPGRAEDPLVDYVEATVASGGGEPQRALVLYTTALERAVAQERGELVSQIRAARGWTLQDLGRREEARADMESARRAFEAIGDHASLARVLNDLAVEPLKLGRLAEGEKLLEASLAAGRAAGSGGAGVVTMNLATVAFLRGYPGRAEARFREAIEAFTRSKSRMLGFAQMAHAQALADLGRPDEANRELDLAIATLAATSSDRGLAYAHRNRGESALTRGDLEGAEASARELEALAKRSGDRSALAYSNWLKGELAAARGDLDEARRRLADARRQLLENGEGEEAAECDLAEAEIDARYGDAAAALPLAMPVAGGGSGALESNSAFFAEALLLRLDVEGGRIAEAGRRLAALEKAAEGTTSLTRRYRLHASRGLLAAAQGEREKARVELEAARQASRDAGRVVDALRLDLDLARLALDSGQGRTAVELADSVARTAASLGLTQLARSARRKGASVPPG